LSGSSRLWSRDELCRTMSFAARGLYAIVDPEHCAGRDPLWVAEAILEGGCAVLQLRDKRGVDQATLELALGLRKRCDRSGVPLVMNDRADIAMLCGADGLHLGQTDLSLEEARAIVGDRWIGVSTHNRSEARQAIAAGAALLGFGPVFPTTTKTNPDPVVGLQALTSLVEEVEVPVVAIGGVDPSNASAVAATGARWGACIGAVCGASDPAEAANALHRALSDLHERDRDRSSS